MYSTCDIIDVHLRLSQLCKEIEMRPVKFDQNSASCIFFVGPLATHFAHVHVFSFCPSITLMNYSEQEIKVHVNQEIWHQLTYGLQISDSWHLLSALL